MIYALNLFNVVPGAEHDYREYAREASRIIHDVGGRLVCAGCPPVRHVATDGTQRDRLVIVAFPDLDAFEVFVSRAERRELHPLRLASTRDYIWTLFEPWDLQAWMSFAVAPRWPGQT